MLKPLRYNFLLALSIKILSSFTLLWMKPLSCNAFSLLVCYKIKVNIYGHQFYLQVCCKFYTYELSSVSVVSVFVTLSSNFSRDVTSEYTHWSCLWRLSSLMGNHLDPALPSRPLPQLASTCHSSVPSLPSVLYHHSPLYSLQCTLLTWPHGVSLIRSKRLRWSIT